MNIVAIVVFFSCLFMGIVMGYYCGSPMYFDLKYAVPLTQRNEERHKVRKEWADGKLISHIKRAAYIRLAFIVAMAVLVAVFCVKFGSPMVGVAGLICYLAGVAVFVLSQTSGSVHDQQVLIKYRDKYHDYLV
ncbi:MAG: hypothetical protein IJH45_03860 [Firmicutes bacterium]|nr:hypothetical protein [Bacillota bacterium]